MSEEELAVVGGCGAMLEDGVAVDGGCGAGETSTMLEVVVVGVEDL